VTLFHSSIHYTVFLDSCSVEKRG